MRVAVVGYSVEGRSAAAYWHHLGHEVTVLDANPSLNVPPGMDHRFGDDYLQNLTQYDLIVRSPGIMPRVLLAANPDLDLSQVTSVTNEFLAQCPARVIGVTGTKGKGTTSSLIAEILQAAGYTVHLGGNIGVPALDLLPQIDPDDWVVLEMSSFQLMDCRTSPHVAVMLMVAPDHLDQHADMPEYVTAKRNIFKFQQPGDRAVYDACNLYSLQAGMAAPADQVGYLSTEGAWIDGDTVKFQDTVICKVSDVSLPGPHNLENVCAALTAVWPIIEDSEPIRTVLREFTGLEHRLEQVATIDGVTYINDSYSVNPQPTLAALRAFSQPKVLIMGGQDRHHDYVPLISQLHGFNVRSVVIVGEVAPQLADLLQHEGVGFQSGGEAMLEIVQTAARAAKPGDVVLLSPGAPSKDMFTDFTDRGVQFKQAVHALEKTANRI